MRRPRKTIVAHHAHLRVEEVLFGELKRDPKEGGVESRSAHISLLFYIGNAAALEN
jgi:hypothetical protein